MVRLEVISGGVQTSGGSWIERLFCLEVFHPLPSVSLPLEQLHLYGGNASLELCEPDRQDSASPCFVVAVTARTNRLIADCGDAAVFSRRGIRGTWTELAV